MVSEHTAVQHTFNTALEFKGLIIVDIVYLKGKFGENIFWRTNKRKAYDEKPSPSKDVEILNID